MSDPREWIGRYCRDGDAAAFRAFYRSQASRLWRFLIARGCDHDTAYDLLSEAFLKFIQTVCRDPHSPVALLYRIAINLHIDSYRRRQASPVDASVSAQDADAIAAPEPDEHRYIRTLVRNAPESEQKLLLMRYWIGLTHKEIAQALDLPEGTVRRQCAEVLSKLRERWGRE